MSADEKETLLEQERRLRAMAEDDGDTWDLSENDRAACRSGAMAMEQKRFKELKRLARKAAKAEGGPR